MKMLLLLLCIVLSGCASTDSSVQEWESDSEVVPSDWESWRHIEDAKEGGE